MVDFQASFDRLLRSEMPDKAVRQLVSGSSVVMLGLPLSGRSFMVASIRRQLLNRGYQPLTLIGNRLLVDQPLSCLALAGIDTPTIPRGAASGAALVGAVNALDDKLSKTGPLIIIDDGEDLDWGTVAVIAALQHKRRVAMLIASARGFPLPSTMVDLISAAQPAIAMPLPDLLFAEISHLMEMIVKGPVSADAVAKVAALSGGLPGMVESITRVCVEEERLVVVNDEWTAVNDLYSLGVGASVIPLLSHVDADQLAALSFIAGAKGRAVSEVMARFDKALIDRLTQRGIIRVDNVLETPRMFVFPLALSLRLQQASIQEPSAVPMHQQLTPTMATVSGVNAPALAQHIALQWAERTAELLQAWRDNPTMATAVPALHALFCGGSIDEIETVLSKTQVSDDGGDLADFTIMRASYLALSNHDFDQASQELTALLGRREAWDMQINAELAHLTLLCQAVPPEGLFNRVLSHSDYDCLSALAAAEVLIAQGQIHRAQKQLTQAMPTSRRLAGIKEILWSLSLIMDGHIDDGITMALDNIEKGIAAANPQVIICFIYVATLGMAMQGRFTEIEGLVEVVYRFVEPSINEGYFKVGAFFLGSLIADCQGRSDYASALVRQAQSLSSGIGPFPAMYAGLHTGLDASDTPVGTWDQVDAMLDRGFVNCAIFLAIDAAERSPLSATMQRLRAESRLVEGRTLKSLLAYVEAVHGQDASVFPGVIEDLRVNCGVFDVTRAQVTYALLLRRDGRIADWLATMGHAWISSAQLGTKSTGLFRPAIEAVDLSAREAEVAHMFIRGMSSGAISARLSLSVRTIEAHMRAIYRKTGTNNREDLTELFHSWLTI
ncbi:MAG: helix-turn-helix transcriptional regulator [Propionibacteriaceae bacterium]|jgi:DNA-binding CsgD family transcriptional regulator|nr:helix-turn-helix transcriptional regulator [Propionibacteriaceae bacterium]